MEAAKPDDAESEEDEAALAVLAKVQAAMNRADEATEKLGDLLKTTAEVVALDLLEAWTAFGRFSRECVGVEPDVLLAGCGFPDSLVGSINDALPNVLCLMNRRW